MTCILPAIRVVPSVCNTGTWYTKCDASLHRRDGDWHQTIWAWKVLGRHVYDGSMYIAVAWLVFRYIVIFALLPSQDIRL